MSLENTFDYKKREYFLSLGLKVRPGLRLHKNPGRHFEISENGERTWRDVPEHVLVVSARAMVLADLLDLSDEVKEDLRLASSARGLAKKKLLQLFCFMWMHIQEEVNGLVRQSFQIGD